MADSSIDNVTQVTAFTGCTEQEAAQILDISGGNVERAVAYFFDYGTADLSPPQPHSHVPRPPHATGDDYAGDDEDIEEIERQFREAELNHREIPKQPPPPPRTNVEPLDDYDRPPDSATTMRIYDRQEDGEYFGRNTSGAQDEAGVDWMYPLQTDLCYPGDLTAAKREGKKSGKWILANLQSHLEFDCLCLNRDTWVDESIREIIEANFIFWQRGHTSPDGRLFMTRYHVALDALPHCNIIDPRTGISMKIITGFRDPGRMSEALLNFLDQNSLDCPKAPVSQPLKVPETLPQQMLIPATSSPANDDVATGKPSAHEPSMVLPSVTVYALAVEDYGPIPVEPAVGDANRTRLAFRLPSNKKTDRHFSKSDTVRSLYAFVAGEGELQKKLFDIFTVTPSVNLSDQKDKSIEEASLLNTLLAVRLSK